MPDLPEWDPKTPAFPAILDTGNNFTFSIYRSQLVRWAGIQPALFRLLGDIRLGEEYIPRHDADLWLHPREPGRMRTSVTLSPYPVFKAS